MPAPLPDPHHDPDPDPDYVDLPQGVAEFNPNVFEAQCVSCNRWTPILCCITEIPDIGYRHYCGGSPRCLP